MDLSWSDLEDWFQEQREVDIESMIEILVDRWRVLNVYIWNDMPRQETAVKARQIARNKCSWLMKVNNLKAFDWLTEKGQGALMPDLDSEERLELNHRAASLEMFPWLMIWRERALVNLQRFATYSDALLQTGRMTRNWRSVANKTGSALEKELEGVIHVIELDGAKPRSHKKKAEEEE
jgi:hypothetical protein